MSAVITTLGVNEGLLRLDERKNGILRLVHLGEKKSYENSSGHFCTGGGSEHSISFIILT